MKNISIIVAIAKNYAIGKDNQLLWHLPEDLKRFKKITTGKTLVMGKKTFESLPVRPLPNRKNIVISDNKDDNFEGCIMAHSIEDAISKMDDTHENFIIGGGSIYRQFLDLAQKLYITLIDKDFEADTYFPEINVNHWQETERIDNPPDKSNNFSYSFISYVKK
ncbi:MAG: dihydrofolate reductase [Bacteroidales bacterium]|nr:dihydrofolate reductase [Bacteroidales bacterium]